MDVVNVDEVIRNSRKQELTAVIATLEQIEVRGSQNLNMLLGCIQHLNKLLAGMGDDE